MKLHLVYKHPDTTQTHINTVHRIYILLSLDQFTIMFPSIYIGCDMIVYPAAFNMSTGPLHWELLQRGRANDLQLYIATISPARDVNFEYVAWGHSMVVDPWGKVLVTADESEQTIYADIGMYKYSFSTV